MEVTNEYRRLKQKMAILELEGANWLLFDLMDFIAEVEDEPERSHTAKLLLISVLRERYKQLLKSYEPENPSQAKLFSI